LEAVHKPKMGRPRSSAAQKAILRATVDLVSAEGFRRITMDQIALKAGVGKMTLYRRWPNKAALVMDALLELIGPMTDFPQSGTALESLKKQLHLQAKFFRGKHGLMIRSLVAEAQSDNELAEAFRERWINPRRRGVATILRKAMEEGELRADLRLETTTDLLYGPIYYRLLLGTGEISSAFIDELYAQFLAGHRHL
jgi:AcrR family transcriptional regulator